MSVGAQWCLREDAHGCLTVPTGICGSPLVSEDAYWRLRVPTDICVCLLVSEGAY